MSALDRTLARGQRRAARLMTDHCTITRPSGTATLDEVTGQVTASVTQAYAGPCQVQTRDLQPREFQSGEAAVTHIAYTVSIPVAAVDVRVGDTVTVTAAADPELVGRDFTVTGLIHKTHLTARRLVVQEVQ